MASRRALPRLLERPRSVAAFPTEPVPLELWPAAELLALEAQVSAGAAPPGQLAVALTPAREGLAGQPAAAEGHCPLSDGRVEGCHLPAGTSHLRLQMGTLAPHLAWNVTLPPQRRVGLGRVEFRSGATLVGRVMALPPVAVEATLVQVEQARSAAPGGARRALAAATQQVEADPWGRFTLAVLEAGGWAVSARQGRCFAPKVPVAVTSRADVMELAQPLQLRCPATLAVQAKTPESDSAGGFQVEVYPWELEEDAERPEAAGEVGGHGRWQSPPLPAGRDLVTLSSPGGGTLASRQVELTGEAVAVAIPLKAVVVPGRLLHGRKGLRRSWVSARPRARLWRPTATRTGTLPSPSPALAAGARWWAWRGERRPCDSPRLP